MFCQVSENFQTYLFFSCLKPLCSIFQLNLTCNLLTYYLIYEREDVDSHSKTSFEKTCFSAWASTLNMGLINKVDMVCLSPVGYGV